MAHDATKCLLGATNSSAKVVTNEPADPADFPAGVAVRRADDGGLQTEDDSTAALIGVSLGKSLSNDSKSTAVARKGLGIPLRVMSYYATGTVTIDAFADLIDAGFDTITVGEVVFVAQSGAATLGDATFRAATSDEATATSLAAQINAHEDLEGLVLATVDGDEVTITALEPGVDGNEIVLEYSDEGTATVGATVSGSGTLEGGIDSPAVVGAKVYVNDDGYGCDSEDADAAATGATYAGTVLDGVDAAGVFQDFCALIDIRGSL